MEQQETCQAIWHYKTESKSSKIIFSTLTSSLEKSFFYKGGGKKKKKGREMFPGGWAGHRQNQVYFLWDHPASIQSQLLPWHSTENMFANVLFVVCVWITKTEKLKHHNLVVADYHFQGHFYSLKVIKKIPSTLFHNMGGEWAISH